MPADKAIDCIVAGEANVDLILQDVPPLEWGKEKTFAGFELVLGGSSAITAFNLAKLGTRVSFIGIVGRDVFGDFIEERLKSASVDLSRLKRAKHEKTGITIWHSNVQKHRAGLTAPGTIPLLRGADIEKDWLARSRHLHVGHYFLLERFHSRAAAVFRTAKQLGLTTSLDCNYDPAEQWDSGIRDVLRYTDIFFPNEEEAKHLTGKKSTLRAAEELARLAGSVVVKMGANGILLHGKNGTIRKQARNVAVVDTTGAGDSFNAGFLSQLLKGRSMDKCAEAGIAAASRCVTRVGGTAAFENL